VLEKNTSQRLVFFSPSKTAPLAPGGMAHQI